ncbi:unnamed protein product, partial [marine sediment metagenome]
MLVKSIGKIDINVTIISENGRLNLVKTSLNTADLIDNPVLLADVFESVIGPFGFYFMVIAAIISTLIAINAALGSAVAVITALARDRFIHEKIRATKTKSNLPTLGLILTVVLVLLFTIFGGNILIAEITNFIYFFALAFVNY